MGIPLEAEEEPGARLETELVVVAVELLNVATVELLPARGVQALPKAFVELVVVAVELTTELLRTMRRSYGRKAQDGYEDEEVLHGVALSSY
jgi:hypothetical protein